LRAAWRTGILPVALLLALATHAQAQSPVGDSAGDGGSGAVAPFGTPAFGATTTPNGGIVPRTSHHAMLAATLQDITPSGVRTILSARMNLDPGPFLPSRSVGAIDPYALGGAGQNASIEFSKDILSYLLSTLTGRHNFTLRLHTGYGGVLYQNDPVASASSNSTEGITGIGQIVSGRGSLGAHYFHQGFGLTLAFIGLKRGAAGISYNIVPR
jgi:hypothetical protein